MLQGRGASLGWPGWPRSSRPGYLQAQTSSFKALVRQNSLFTETGGYWLYAYYLYMTSVRIGLNSGAGQQVCGA